MEIITAQSEQRLVEILPLVERDVGAWGYVHINIATMHDHLQQKDGMSKDSLIKIRGLSRQIAQRLSDLGLDQFEGNILIFEDCDVIALFAKKPGMVEDVLAKLRQEFDRNGLVHLLVIDEMKERLTQLV